jgi:hypothetical protein
MRIDIDIDDQLIEKAFKLTQAKTIRELIEQALTLLITVKQQQKISDSKVMNSLLSGDLLVSGLAPDDFDLSRSDDVGREFKF